MTVILHIYQPSSETIWSEEMSELAAIRAKISATEEDLAKHAGDKELILMYYDRRIKCPVF